MENLCSGKEFSRRRSELGDKINTVRKTIIKHQKGFLTVRDILSDEGKLKSWGTLQSYNATGAEYSVLTSVFDAFPLEWKTLSKDTPNNLLRNTECHDNTFPTSSEEEIEKPPVSKSKYEQLFPTHDLPWKNIYLLPRSVTLDSKMREFQYKVLSRILYANKALHSMGIVNSPACTFCQESDESLEHLFLHCPTSSIFWLSVVVAKTRGRFPGRGRGVFKFLSLFSCTVFSNDRHLSFIMVEISPKS